MGKEYNLGDHMNKFNSVLLLGSNMKNRIINSIFDMGYTPILRDKMNEAFYKIRHDNFKAILIDRDRVEIDALEFILNVRDIDQDIPIIVFGKPVKAYNDHLLQKQENVFLLPQNTEQLKKDLNNIFKDIAS